MAFYDNYGGRTATQFRKDIQSNFYRKLFARNQLENLSDKNFFEIGPGTGTVARLVKELGANYSALEANSGLAENLRKDGFDIHIGLCPPLPISDESVDFVFCSHLIEHLPGPQEAYELFKEASRALKPGGKFILIAPDYLRMKGYFWDCDYTHTFPISERRLAQLARDSGLKVANSKLMIEPLSGPLSGLLQLPVSLFLAIYPYRALQACLPRGPLSSLSYKIRSTFAEVVFFVAEKTEKTE